MTRDALAAVEDHHEKRGGGGCPTGRSELSEMSQMWRLTDEFTAKPEDAIVGSLPVGQVKVRIMGSALYPEAAELEPATAPA